jgi:hypothetical protein
LVPAEPFVQFLLVKIQQFTGRSVVGDMPVLGKFVQLASRQPHIQAGFFEIECFLDAKQHIFNLLRLFLEHTKLQET